MGVGVDVGIGIGVCIPGARGSLVPLVVETTPASASGMRTSSTAVHSLVVGLVWRLDICLGVVIVSLTNLGSSGGGRLR